MYNLLQMTPETSKKDENYLNRLFDQESQERLEKEGIIEQLPPPEEEKRKKETILYQSSGQSPRNQESESPDKPFVAKITPPNQLSNLIIEPKKEVSTLRKKVVSLARQPAPEPEEPPEIILPERPNSPRKKALGLPGRETKTPGDTLRVKNGRSVPESKCRGIYWVIEYLARAQKKKRGTKVPLEEITYQASKKVLKRALREDPESVAFARARLHADLRRFLKEWRKHYEKKVYQPIARSRDRQRVSAKFRNPAWKKLYQKILKYYGDLSVREFIQELETVLPRPLY